MRTCVKRSGERTLQNNCLFGLGHAVGRRTNSFAGIWWVTQFRSHSPLALVPDALADCAGHSMPSLAAIASERYHGGQVAAVFVATRRIRPDLADTLKLCLGFRVRGLMLNRFNPGGCGAGHFAHYRFDTAGDVRPCNHTPTVLGNAWREPFAEIIVPSRLADFVPAVPL
jgi:hypothetical protein